MIRTSCPNAASSRARKCGEADQRGVRGTAGPSNAQASMPMRQGFRPPKKSSNWFRLSLRFRITPPVSPTACYLETLDGLGKIEADGGRLFHGWLLSSGMSRCPHIGTLRCREREPSIPSMAH